MGLHDPLILRPTKKWQRVLGVQDRTSWWDHGFGIAAPLDPRDGVRRPHLKVGYQGTWR